MSTKRKAVTRPGNMKSGKFQTEAERDSGFSDASSEHLSAMDTTDSEDSPCPAVHDPQTPGAQGATPQPPKPGPQPTSMAVVGGSYSNLSPMIIMNNVLLKQPGDPPPALKPWRFSPAVEVVQPVVQQPQVVFLQPVMSRQTSSASKEPASSSSSSARHRRSKKYLPILKSYPKIAPRDGGSSSGRGTSSTPSSNSSTSSERSGQSDHSQNLPKKHCKGVGNASPALTLTPNCNGVGNALPALTLTPNSNGVRTASPALPLTPNCNGVGNALPALTLTPNCNGVRTASPALPLTPNCNRVRTASPALPNLVSPALQSQLSQLSSTDTASIGLSRDGQAASARLSELPALSPLCFDPKIQALPDPQTISVDQPDEESEGDIRRKRFCNTYNILSKSGLLDITLRTKELLRQNKRTQSDLERLKEQTDWFLQALRTGDTGICVKLQASLQEEEKDREQEGAEVK